MPQPIPDNNIINTSAVTDYEAELIASRARAAQADGGVVPSNVTLDRLLNWLAGEVIVPAQTRGHQRHAINAPALLGVQLPGQSFKALYRGWATDLSSDGVGLLLEHQLPTEINMALNLDALLGQPCILPVRIVYCRQLLPHTFRIGAGFVL